MTPTHSPSQQKTQALKAPQSGIAKVRWGDTLGLVSRLKKTPETTPKMLDKYPNTPKDGHTSEVLKKTLQEDGLEQQEEQSAPKPHRRGFLA